MDMNYINDSYSYLQCLYLLHVMYKYNGAQSKTKTKKKYCKKRMWIREIFRKRNTEGAFYTLVQEIRENDLQAHFNYFRMDKISFDKILNKIAPTITKVFHTRKPISPAEKLSATLRYLASGDSMVSISYQYRLGKTTVSHIINETCEAIWNTLHPTFLKKPDITAWRSIAEGFEEHWQLPNCIGAIDGKHVVIQAPPKAGSEFYNYKNNHSIILLAVCDAKYKFAIVDIGAKGRQSDGGVLRNSEFGKNLFNNTLDIPAAQPIEYGGEDVPFYIVGDEAFPLRNNLMRPYPGRMLTLEKRVFNYRLSRGRRVIENAFGILVSRWRIFRKPIIGNLQTIENIIKATVCLHNFLLEQKDFNQQYCPFNYHDGENADGSVTNGQWRIETPSRNMTDVSQSGSNFFSIDAASVRNALTSYFMTEGAVPFQWNK